MLLCAAIASTPLYLYAPISLALHDLEPIISYSPFPNCKTNLIRNLGSSADIDMIADYRVSQVGEMRYGRFRANIGVFDFDECSDLGIITDTCITTDIRIGSDDGSLPEVDIAIDICSRFQNYAFL